jgi:serine protease
MHLCGVRSAARDRVFALLLVLLGLPSAALAGTNVIPLETESPWRAPGYVPHELLVKFVTGITLAQATEAVRTKGALSARKVLTPDGLVEVELPPGASMDAAIDSLSTIPGVEYATPNGYAHGFFAPNDTIIGDGDLAWNLRAVGAFDAWDVVTGNPNIVLAIIDTGVAYEDHPIPSYETPFVKPGVTMYRKSPELAGPFLPGRDFVHDDDHANDDCGHGTMVATIATGQANNLAGSAGIAFGVTLLPIKALRFDAGGEMGAIVQGIRYAADQGADIANMSLGFAPTRQLIERGLTKKEVRDFFRPLKDAVKYAQRRGVILVAAAGNFAYPEVSLPAGYPGVISVGATGVDDRIASYSSWGKGLEFVAPGGDFTDVNGDHVQDQIPNLSMKPFRSSGSLANPDSFNVFFFIGTSAAAPHVSGAVALLMSMGLKSQGEIESVLRATAIDPFGNPGGRDPVYGCGLIQIDKAVRLAASRHHAAAEASPSTAGPGARLLTRNPSREGAAISFRTSTPGNVQVQVFDVAGRLVRTLESGSRPAGARRVRWDGKDDRGGIVGSGVYFFRVATPDGIESRRIAVLR